MAVTNLGEGQSSSYTPPARTSFTDNSFLRVSKTSGSEYTSRLKEAIAAEFLVGYPEIKREILVLDKEVYKGIKFSCLVLTGEVPERTDIGKVFHVLLLAATGEVKNEFKNIGNRTIEVQLFPGDGLDAYLTNFIIKELEKSFSGNIYNADGQVVPADFNVSDKEMVRSLSVNCLRAIFAEINTLMPNYQTLNLMNVSKDSNLVIDISTGDSKVVDAAGYPVRSSFKIDFSAISKQANTSSGSIHSEPNQRQNITSMCGFLDLVFSPEDPSMLLVNPFTQNNPQGPKATKRYAPRAILTMFDAETVLLSHVLLSVYSTLALQHQKNWVQLLRRKVPTGRTPVYDDIGYLNIEANMENNESGYGNNIDTSNFDLNTLGQFANALIQDNLMLSIDCPNATSETYYTRVFQLAAMGNPNAHEAIWEVANQMTDGILSQYFPKTSPIVNSDFNKVLLGRWTDLDGNVRDIREIDTITVANMVGKSHPEMIIDWFNLNIPGFYSSEDERLEKMKSMINFILEGAAIFDGTALRVNFSSEFLMAFIRSITECGVSISNVITPINTNEMSSRRSVFNVDNSAFNGVNTIFKGSGFGDSSTRSFGRDQRFKQW